MKKFGRVLSASQPSHSHRTQQLASLLRLELGQLLPREIELPSNVILTVSAVTVTADLSLARVGLSVLPFARGAETLALVIRRRREFQAVLFERLKLYRIPQLEFYLDDSGERAGRINELLDQLDGG